MILVDTSVWVDHLRKGVEGLSALLREGVVLSHPFVIGELACGDLKNRAEILDRLAALPGSVQASHDEVLRLTSARGLSGRGLGWIDVHLLASALLSRCTLWTKDRALASASRSLGVMA